VATAKFVVFAVNVMPAPTNVESDPLAMKVVEPQLLLAEIPVGTTVKYGRTILIVSSISRSTLRENVYESVVGAEVIG
jgi:hypothetical protein